MATLRRSWSTVLLIGALAFGTLGIALHAADDAAKEPTPRDILDPLFEKSEWTAQWVEDAEAYQVVFKGPDVWVRVTGDFVAVQSYIGRVPRNVAAGPPLAVLRRNFELYEGKYGIDKENDLWFEVNTHADILTTARLDQQIAVVADTAANTSQIIKTEKPDATTP